MAGETVRSEAICLDIRPWSRTSHVVSWLTPRGRIVTIVKGAVRPKSSFLGQYDLNYTCELLYYARAKGELHPLRDCAPLVLREPLRGDYRALALAGYFRALVAELAPTGEECAPWYDLLTRALDGLLRGGPFVGPLVRFELKALDLAGLAPDFSGYDRAAEWSEFSIESGAFVPSGGRTLRLSRAVAAFLSQPDCPPPAPDVLHEAVRALGVFSQFHIGGDLVQLRRTICPLLMFVL